MVLRETETEALWKLSSAYEACTLSAHDPVSVSSDINASIGRHTFSHVFYDYTDPGKNGIGIMNQRIREGSSDIQTHLRIHDTLLNNFYSIDEGLKTNNRVKIVEAGTLVFENLKNYGRLVGEHSKRFGERAFLYYPTCLPGHIFFPPGTGVIRGKVFNLEQDAEGLEREIKRGLTLLANFPPCGKELEEIRMYEGHDSGNGILDTSLRGRLELTKLLLERAGFQIAVR